MDKFVIFHVEGGLGKNVASTAILKNIYKKYPDRKLIVVCSFPEIFLNNPYIHRVYRLGVSPYFWDDYINGKDTIVLRREPYFESSHMMQQSPLVETWHKMYELPFTRKDDLPELYLNMTQNEMHKQWQRSRPIMLLHTNGGPIMDGQPIYSWTRDMPKNVIEALVQQFGQQYHIIQICKHESQSVNHPAVETITRQMSNTELFTLLKVTAKRVLIDSCLQHAAAAFNLPSVVLWIGTHPKMFGYDIHKNIEAKPPIGNTKRIDSLYFDYALDGQFHECPYNSQDEMFDVTQIINEVNKF
jgi:ADP-heptose:LPS heptosyltransferase